jgi:hypothetical protein
MKLTDAELEGFSLGSLTHYSEIRIVYMAHELLLARKVIEAARPYLDSRSRLILPLDSLPKAIERGKTAAEALEAYDALEGKW